ncbi:NUDIX hydrolase [Ensifer adhaerens]|uniref:NUDIX hydrolase n=1 Tax=Ensifer adhaerens TaxID=106592 RepID=UPI001CBD1B94|nr:NUDIX hydrolase [Ensifer adhaerens]MBZ7924974.1 NUDIX hydrolase [Ensifer adhaerens]UAX95819.1 NUDIX hydrolase [Ensifer adhaerens]UAY04840.1 NUDIX hydrolase [Ensifer adhaerens]UAY10272.1 NUDIX hydrolase [Ensifer adhaerens]
MSFTEPAFPLREHQPVLTDLRHGSFKIQYAAICFRRVEALRGSIEILLITSRDTGRWVLPKGWPMRKKKPHEVARIEAWEEAGICGRAQKKVWGHYAYAKKLDSGKLVPAKVQVYLLDVAETTDDFPEREQRKRRWFTPHMAASAVIEPELRGLISKLEVRERKRATVAPFCQMECRRVWFRRNNGWI